MNYINIIGTKEEFLHRRLAIQAAIHWVKEAVPDNLGGHGRRRKMKSLEDYQHLEKRDEEHKLHIQPDADRLLRKTQGSHALFGQPTGEGRDSQGRYVFDGQTSGEIKNSSSDFYIFYLDNDTRKKEGVE